MKKQNKPPVYLYQVKSPANDVLYVKATSLVDAIVGADKALEKTYGKGDIPNMDYYGATINCLCDVDDIVDMTEGK